MCPKVLRALSLLVAALVGISPAAVALAHGAAHHRGPLEFSEGSARQQSHRGESHHEHDAPPAGDEGSRVAAETGGDHAHVVAAAAYRPRSDFAVAFTPVEPADAPVTPLRHVAPPPPRIDGCPRAGPCRSAHTQPRAPPLA